MRGASLRPAVGQRARSSTRVRFDAQQLLHVLVDRRNDTLVGRVARVVGSLVVAARMRAWQQYIDEVPTPAIRPPSFNAYFVPIWANMTGDQFVEYTERLPLRKHFYRKMGRNGFSPADIDEALDKLRQTLRRMEQSLAGGAWLVDDRYSLADVSITPMIVRMEDLGLSSMWVGLPPVKDWYARIQARPNFSVAYMPGSRDLGPSC